MSDPNERQVGGSHYKVGVEHWDWTEAQGVGYLEGCATKYVVRWRKKNGLEDLEKALHYVEKLMALHGNAKLRRMNRVTIIEAGMTERFLTANGLTLEGLEANVVYGLLLWRTNKDLITVRECIRELIEEAKLDASVQA